MKQLKAEVMSVGDEMVSGQRLDTNSQWLSHSLGDLGIRVCFHSTVGDDLNDHVSALQVAIERCEIVIITGGLGPTADDLTRLAIADAVNVDLEFDQSVFGHIQKIYHRYGREMPESNRAQAYFPVGSKIIPNPEGTAPGIDLTVDRQGRLPCRVVALPGVPAEMKQMWQATIEPELSKFTGVDSTIHHHTLHCFGAGESTIESMLPDLVKRGRDPQVGITASASTISLRVSTRSKSKIECQIKMQSTIDLINDRLGDLVFGENGQTLDDIVRQLLQTHDVKLAIADVGLGSDITRLLVNNENDEFVLPVTGEFRSETGIIGLVPMANRILSLMSADFALMVGPLNNDESSIVSGKSFFNVAVAGPGFVKEEQFRYGGHSAWRKDRAIKQVLNYLRLHLQSMPSSTTASDS